jgi:hypothetical protein
MPACPVRAGDCLNLDLCDLHDDHDLKCYPFGSNLQNKNKLPRGLPKHKTVPDVAASTTASGRRGFCPYIPSL